MKRVLLYGFNTNQAIFITPSVRYILGTCRTVIIENSIDLKRASDDFDIICVNCGLNFWELDFSLRQADEHVKDYIVCLSLLPVPQENLNLILKYDVQYIMFDLENEEEFVFCKSAIQNQKSYRSKGTFECNQRFNGDSIDIYQTLSAKQKCAFNYMMCGKTQKEFCNDLGFNSLGTASTHWQIVLQKYNVDSVIKLRNLLD